MMVDDRLINPVTDIFNIFNTPQGGLHWQT